jgi:2-dehydro-3-deoxygalactonokinase
MVEWPNFNILAEVKNSRGVAHFTSAASMDFEHHLKEGLRELDEQLEQSISDEPLMISGMASASIGWKELPYAQLPVSVGMSDLISERLPEITYGEVRLSPILISGLKSEIDVMRGEEVELMGLLSRSEVADYLEACLVLLPGTHSKHIDVKNNKILNFDTHMTGELFDLMSSQSVLKHSLAPPNFDRSFSQAAFSDGVETVEQHGLSQSLFKVRSLSLLKGASANWCFNFLSGLCIGHECLSLKTVKVPILCSASKAISNAYQTAASQLKLEQFHSLPAERHDLLAAEGQVLFVECLK